MSAVTQIAPERRSILATMATRYNMEPAAFEQTLRATVVPQNCTREQFAACLVVANEYRLNPLTKEIYFFPARGGGVVPIVGVDGWIRIINEHPAFDGMEFDTSFDGTKPSAVTCRMFRKDRSRPVTVTEFMSECGRSTDPWKQSPARMLRHKAMIQASRYAFGFSGIYDPDEAERFAGEPARDTFPPRPPASSQSPAQLTPPRPPALKPPSPQQPAHETVDYEQHLTALDDMASACEAIKDLHDAEASAAAWLNEAPVEVRGRGDQILSAHRERIERTASAVVTEAR